MPENDRGKPQVGESERSFDPSDNGGRQPDLFSRNDREGIPAKPSSKPDQVAQDPSVLKAGEQDGYQADTFSRGDEEGVPQDDLGNAEAAAKGESRSEDRPDDVRKRARDDADSRDARPTPPREGGVR